MTLNGQTIQDVLIAIGLIGGTLVYFRSRIPQQNVANLTALTNTYEKRIRALEDELKDNHKVQLQNISAISDLQGQVKVYKELPLQELATGITKVSDSIKEVSKSNIEILNQLKKTADIAAEDRSVLTNQDLHIRTEVKKALKDVP